jgi:hypothetical protein
MEVAMTEEEIITAVEVTGGNSDDGKQFKELLDQSLAAGIEVDERSLPIQRIRVKITWLR